jgi:DNA-binding response OmpR family regulator
MTDPVQAWLPAGGARRLLVFETQMPLLLEMRQMFEACGWQVYGTIQADEARSLLDRIEPHVAIISYTLEGMSLLRHIRGDAHCEELFVILLTSNPNDSFVIEGYYHGADMCLQKPLSADDIETICRRR